MSSVNNGIPFVPENTIDPASGLNEAINWIDALLQVAVVSVNSNTPPGSPVEGSRYVVGPSPTGAWAGQANKLARFLNSAWAFYDARYVLNTADGLLYRRQTTTWAATSASFTGGTLTSALNAAPPVTLASAATVNIGAAASNSINITGTTAITAFDTIAAGATRRLTFAAALVLTHNATSFILPTGANIATAAGDVSDWESLGSGNWRCTGYQRANGRALDDIRTAGGTIDGGLTFTNARYLRGPSAEVNALCFEPDADNQNANVFARPRGTGGAGGFIGYNSSNTTDFARMQFYINSTGLTFSQSIGGAGAYVPMIFTTGGAIRMTISTAGALTVPGVYATTTASAANVFVDSAGLLQRSTSSEQYKREIEPMELEYAEKAYDLTEIWYRSECAGDRQDWGWWGFSAEQAGEVDPRLVHWRLTEPVEVEGEPDNLGEPTTVIEHRPLEEPVAEGFAYERLVVHHNRLMKVHRDEIAGLKELIAALDSRLTLLEA